MFQLCYQWNTTHSLSSFMHMYTAPLSIIECSLCCTPRSYIYVQERTYLSMCRKWSINQLLASCLTIIIALKRSCTVTQMIFWDCSLVFPLWSISFFNCLYGSIFPVSCQKDSLLMLHFCDSDCLVRLYFWEVCHVVIQLEQSHCLFSPVRSH